MWSSTSSTRFHRRGERIPLCEQPQKVLMEMVPSSPTFCKVLTYCLMSVIIDSSFYVYKDAKGMVTSLFSSDIPMRLVTMQISLIFLQDMRIDGGAEENYQHPGTNMTINRFLQCVFNKKKVRQVGQGNHDGIFYLAIPSYFII